MMKVVIFITLVGVFVSSVIANDVIGSFQNTNIERLVDISSQLVRTTVKISAENTDPKTSTSAYYLALDSSAAQHLSYISATSEAIPLAVQQASVGNGQNAVHYKISLPTPLSPGKTVKLEIVYVLSHFLEPHPKEIVQGERQLVIYKGDHYQLSPYPTTKQTTKIKLASNKVESFTNTLKPNAQSDSAVTYGPYNKVAAYTKEPCKVHYENHRSFLVVKSLKRWIEVSHWGMVAVEEKLDVKHEGAVLKGSFSRYDFQREMTASSAVKSFKTFLPPGAIDVYYRDEIGNISTSNMRVREDYVEVELRPRFPLFGGWKTYYVLGYYVPAYEFLYHDGGDGFVLKMNFIDHIFDDVVVDSAELKIVLPEGARDIKLKLPFSAKRHSDEKHYTYLDTTGRPVVVLSKDNLVEDHIQPLEIHYKFNKTLMLQEPLLVSIALFLLFLTVIVYVRLDFSIKKDTSQELKWKMDSLLDKVRRVQDRRDNNYSQMDAALSKCKLSKDMAGFQSTIKNQQDLHKNLTQEMTDLTQEAKNLGAGVGVLEAIDELQKMDKTYKDLISSQVGNLEKFIGGKLNKQQYTDQELSLSKKKQDTYEKIRDLCSRF